MEAHRLGGLEELRHVLGDVNHDVVQELRVGREGGLLPDLLDREHVAFARKPQTLPPSHVIAPGGRKFGESPLDELLDCVDGDEPPSDFRTAHQPAPINRGRLRRCRCISPGVRGDHSFRSRPSTHAGMQCANACAYNLQDALFRRDITRWLHIKRECTIVKNK